MAKGKSVCIYGAKGGIGKTTFVINLAGIISKLDKKVLIIDLDLCTGAIAASLNKDVSKTIYNFYEDYSNNRFDNIDKYITKYNDNISFLACPKDPRFSNKIESSIITTLLDKCKYLYDVILIDTTSYLNEINVLALDKCDEILFMTTNDLTSLKNLKNVLNILYDSDISKYKIILNNSVKLDKKYFSNYDIKNILKSNIDYIISDKFHYNKLDSLVYNGEIMSLRFSNYPDEKILYLIARDILKEEA